jgi:hypothetical protein
MHFISPERPLGVECWDNSASFQPQTSVMQFKFHYPVLLRNPKKENGIGKESLLEKKFSGRHRKQL